MIVLGADMHKSSHTLAAVVATTGEMLGDKTVVVGAGGFGQALDWARELGRERVWALEDCRHVSGSFERFLLAQGERVVRVATKLMAGERRAARARGKSDLIDALAVARAALREGLDRLPVAELAGRDERFALEHEDVLRFVPGLGWFHWDGMRWERDIDGAAERCAKTTARGIWKRAHELASADKKKAYTHAMKSESARGLAAMAKLAQTEELMITPVELFDVDAFKLTVVNGTVGLRSGELGLHWREDRITRLARVRFDPQARCERWDRFLSSVFGGDESPSTDRDRGLRARAVVVGAPRPQLRT